MQDLSKVKIDGVEYLNMDARPKTLRFENGAVAAVSTLLRTFDGVQETLDVAAGDTVVFNFERRAVASVVRVGDFLNVKLEQQ